MLEFDCRCAGLGPQFQTSRAALEMHCYNFKNHCVRQWFRIHFFHRKRSIMFLNSWTYIQHVLGGSGQASAVSVYCISTVFEIIISFHYVIMVSNPMSSRTLSVTLNYLSGIIIVLDVHRVWSACTQIMPQVGIDGFRAQLLLYIWYKGTNGYFKQLHCEEGSSPLIQRESRTPSVSFIKSWFALMRQALSATRRHIILCFIWLCISFLADENWVQNTIYTREDSNVSHFHYSAPSLVLIAHHYRLSIHNWTPLLLKL